MFKPKLVLKAAQELSSAKKSVKKNTKRLLFMTTSSTRQSASLKLLQHAQAGADISCWQAGEKLQANANWFCVVIHLSQLAPELISQYLAIASQWPVVIIANKNQARDFQQLENTAVDFEWLSENVLDIDYLNRAIDIAVLKYRLSHAADEQGYGDHRDEFAREGVLDRTQFFQQANTLLATSQSTQQAQYFQLVQCRWIKTKSSELTWQDSELLSIRFERFLAQYVRKGTLLGRLMDEQTGLLSINNQPMDSKDLDNFHQLCQQEFSDIKLMIYISTAAQVTDTEGLVFAMQQAVQEIARDKLVQEAKLEWQSYEQANIGLMNGMHLALQRQEFVLHYQPQLEVESGEWIGAEALIRWQHPSFGLLPPGAFIKEAESTGLILVLGRWALHEAIRAWKTIKIDTGRTICMAVNVSFPQVADANFADEVLQALAENDMPHEYLELELTETTVIKDEQITMNNLTQLLNAGIKISLDDFGTGFSSLSHLSDLPISGIKLDRAFVSPLADEGAQAHIAAAMIALAKQLKLETTAEGVEDARCMEKIKQLGCDRVQGYYFSRPLALEDLLIRAEDDFSPSSASDNG